MPKFSINHGKQILHERNAVKLKVFHGYGSQENEVIINGVWCDIGSHKVSEDSLVTVAADATVCDDCYDHYA